MCDAPIWFSKGSIAAMVSLFNLSLRIEGGSFCCVEISQLHAQGDRKGTPLPRHDDHEGDHHKINLRHLLL
jgi:hypothetical protein